MKLKQKGQALLLVIVTMTVALAVVANVAVRTISSISTSSRSDTASRVLAAAEGGAERFLAVSYASLDNLVTGGVTLANCVGAESLFDYSRSSCYISFPKGGADVLDSRAYTSVERFSTNKTGPNRYEFYLSQNFVKEVSLDGYDGEIEICWKPANTTSASDIYYTGYAILSANYKRISTAISANCSGCFSNSDYENSRTGYQSSSTDGSGLYSYCYTTTDLDDLSLGSEDKKGLRLKSLGNDSIVSVRTVSGSLPVQGFKITSVGEITSPDQKVSKTVIVYKSLPYLPSVFDFGTYSE